MLGKQRGENPREVAERIVGQLKVGDLCESPVIAGPGFINFTLRPGAVAEKTAGILSDERLGVVETESPRRIVIDFGSPNVAKPMHVGHIRSTVLGDALARIATFLGHEVIRDNHIGDWGTQFGMVIYGWKNLLDQRALQQHPLAEIVRIYKETNALATSDPQIREACRQELVKLQAGDKENIDIWNECVALSMQDFEHVYNYSTFITTSSAAKVSTTIDSRALSNACSNPGLLKSARAQLSFFSAISRSWPTNHASFANATADSITPRPISRQSTIASTI